MPAKRSFPRGAAPWLWVAVGVAAVVLAALLAGVFLRPGPGGLQVAEPAPPAVAVPDPRLPDPEGAGETDGPGFDVVRREADGTTLVAGTARPDTEVSLVIDGVTRASARSDARGQFVLILVLDPSPEPRVLWVVMREPGGGLRTSSDTVILPPFAARGPADPAKEPSAPTLVNAAEGVQLLDPPSLSEGGAVRLDSLDYSAEGDVVLRGRAAPGGTVSALLDGEPRADTPADADGHWTLRLPDVAPGDYALSVTRSDPGGAVSDRVSTPFRRAAPEDVAEALSGAPARVITVQPGASLWAIARGRYGDGTRYVQVFEANRDAIRDPDLIYPGQIFRLPGDERP